MSEKNTKKNESMKKLEELAEQLKESDFEKLLWFGYGLAAVHKETKAS